MWLNGVPYSPFTCGSCGHAGGVCVVTPVLASRSSGWGTAHGRPSPLHPGWTGCRHARTLPRYLQWHVVPGTLYDGGLYPPALLPEKGETSENGYLALVFLPGRGPSGCCFGIASLVRILPQYEIHPVRPIVLGKVCWCFGAWAQGDGDLSAEPPDSFSTSSLKSAAGLLDILMRNVLLWEPGTSDKAEFAVKMLTWLISLVPQLQSLYPPREAGGWGALRAKTGCPTRKSAYNSDNR